MHEMSTTHNLQDLIADFSRLVEVIVTLRSENGCPWDRKQTPESFHHYILEEYHELVQAMRDGDDADIEDELGDLLFLVLLTAYMFEQRGTTTLSRIIRGATEKMVRRHPHVFGEARADTPEQVIDNWTQIKASEETISKRQSVLDGIPRSLPALARAQKLTRRAEKVGFDWDSPAEVLSKIDEEAGELRDAVESGSSGDIREEIGDLLFVTVNAARHLSVNAETALGETADKFERRFRHIERRLTEAGKDINSTTLAEMDALWDEAKQTEKSNNPHAGPIEEPAE